MSCSHRQQSSIQRIGIRTLAPLSKQLAEELQFALVIPRVSAHPFFRTAISDLEVRLHIVCIIGVRQMALASGDVLIFRDAEASFMYVLLSGEVSYILGDWVDLLRPPLENGE